MWDKGEKPIPEVSVEKTEFWPKNPKVLARLVPGRRDWILLILRLEMDPTHKIVWE